MKYQTSKKSLEDAARIFAPLAVSHSKNRVGRKEVATASAATKWAVLDRQYDLTIDKLSEYFSELSKRDPGALRVAACIFAYVRWAMATMRGTTGFINVEGSLCGGCMYMDVTGRDCDNEKTPCPITICQSASRQPFHTPKGWASFYDDIVREGKSARRCTELVPKIDKIREFLEPYLKAVEACP